MTTMTLFDNVPASDLRRTADGYLVGAAKVARTGIQVYHASELGLDEDRMIRVYRPEDEVFSADAMRSYAFRPLTVDHPPEMVNADNWRKYSRGQTGPDVARDGEMISVPMVLMDSEAIREWEDGKRELSMGYTSDIEFTDGETPTGEKYDAIQSKMRMNHLALVARARGGSQLRLGDNQEEDVTMTDAKLRTISVDGLSVETTDAGAQAIAKLQKELEDARSKLTDAETAHATALAERDTELATKDSEIDGLKKQVMTDAELDKAVKERADLIGKAKQVADQDYSGKTPAEIRKAAVVAVIGDGAIEGKSDAYIEARFDTLIESSDADPVRQVIKGRPTQTTDGYGQYVADLSNAWKGSKEVQ